MYGYSAKSAANALTTRINATGRRFHYVKVICFCKPTAPKSMRSEIAKCNCPPHNLVFCSALWYHILAGAV